MLGEAHCDIRPGKLGRRGRSNNRCDRDRAALSDAAVPSFSLDTQGITITACVSAANTVSVRFQNESGGVLDIGSGAFKATVFESWAGYGCLARSHG